MNPMCNFWERVTRTERCWLWEGTLDKDGYGRATYQGKTSLASRVSFILTHGPIKEGAHICHTCDNRRCVRPDHLYEGDHASNMRDKVERDRSRNQHTDATHCDKGHELTFGNTYEYPDGRRSCRVCRKANRATWIERKATL